MHATSGEALAKLKPIKDGGTVTFGGQTHPADGNAALIMTTPERVAECGQVLDSGDTAAIQKFFAEAVPNGSELIAAELLAFRETYVNG